MKPHSNNDNILIRYNRDPLKGRTRQQFIKELTGLLKGRIARAYVFGSFTTENFDNTSDVDIILVVDTSRPFPERPIDFEDLWDVFPALDILVYTPEEFKQLTTEPSVGFWTSVVETMQRVV